MASSMPSKKQKKNKKHDKYSLSDLKTLGHQLLSSRAHVNNLPLLLSFITPSTRPKYALESLLSLQSFFIPLLPQLPSTTVSSSFTSDSQGDPEFIYRTWVRSKFDDFVQSLLDIVICSQSDDSLREVVLDTLMEFVKVGNGGKFHSAIYYRLLHNIVHSSLEIDDILLELLASKYFKYIDIRYFTYISFEKLSRSIGANDISDDRRERLDTTGVNQPESSLDLSVHKLSHLLSRIPPLEGSDDKAEYDMWNPAGIFTEKENDKGHTGKQRKGESTNIKVLSPANIAKKMKLKFTKAWISFLRLTLPVDVYKEVLVNLHQVVIPYLSNPLMLCDFLTRSYDIGGVVSVMALSSLFVLMTQHSLEYPNFYEKLYALLEPSIFMAKHRAKFFQLLDSCLKSPLLPAYLAAAFCKKLSRISLAVPPSGALVINALIHNLLRRHPSINCLVHQEDGNETTKDTTGAESGADDDSTEASSPSREMSSVKPSIDPFDDKQTDPLKTNAMRSSLWEVDTLRHHYCPPVSRFVLSLENDLTVRAKTTEVSVKDFSSGSYATIFGDEIRRRVKQVPLAFYTATPTMLFPESDFLGWSFKMKDKDSTTVLDNTSKENDHISAKRSRVEETS
ncbi:protein NUCLEOLAR COMPLEX ASSOCIATED 4 [Solanum stenotomum]|uniref:protein NUCLEOLAR COMPLEX ASSOCIATED 4 n=1 Tax=Solanum stenotomum TaxID=172797 RepID=UPI0020D16CA0|nr:protein NUCLEOLAR COMPLEX ASSOCIATED 4 [Solanum stenotomum]XP_049402357.1 protein NUCLEOLAR COMPLEX ASSOCIATED 4 [Solanum stenotomum]